MGPEGSKFSTEVEDGRILLVSLNKLVDSVLKVKSGLTLDDDLGNSYLILRSFPLRKRSVGVFFRFSIRRCVN